jgi:hypothetical protein
VRKRSGVTKRTWAPGCCPGGGSGRPTTSKLVAEPAAEGQPAHPRRGRHTGHRGQGIGCFLEEARLRPRRVGRIREGDVQGQDPARVEAGIDAGEAHVAAEQEPAAGHQHEGQGHLRGHQDAARPAARGTDSRGRRAFAQRRQERRGADAQGRRHAGEDGGHDAQRHGEGQDRAAHARLHVARDLGGQGDRQRAEGPVAEGQSGRARDHREDQALGEELPQQAPASGPERAADRELAHPGERAGQHQAGHVHAGHDQQHRHAPP